VTYLYNLREAVSELASRTAEKLRRQCGATQKVLVFIQRSQFRSDPHYSRAIVVPLGAAQRWLCRPVSKKPGFRGRQGRGYVSFRALRMVIWLRCPCE
jgi:hypothetical protein